MTLIIRVGASAFYKIYYNKNTLRFVTHKILIIK